MLSRRFIPISAALSLGCMISGIPPLEADDEALKRALGQTQLSQLNTEAEGGRNWPACDQSEDFWCDELARDTYVEVSSQEAVRLRQSIDSGRFVLSGPEGAFGLMTSSTDLAGALLAVAGDAACAIGRLRNVDTPAAPGFLLHLDRHRRTIYARDLGSRGVRTPDLAALIRSSASNGAELVQKLDYIRLDNAGRSAVSFSRSHLCAFKLSDEAGKPGYYVPVERQKSDERGLRERRAAPVTRSFYVPTPGQPTKSPTNVSTPAGTTPNGREGDGNRRVSFDYSSLPDGAMICPSSDAEEDRSSITSDFVNMLFKISPVSEPLKVHIYSDPPGAQFRMGSDPDYRRQLTNTSIPVMASTDDVASLQIRFGSNNERKVCKRLVISEFCHPDGTRTYICQLSDARLN